MPKYNTTCCEIRNVSKSCIGNCMDDDNGINVRGTICDTFKDIIDECTLLGILDHYSVRQLQFHFIFHMVFCYLLIAHIIFFPHQIHLLSKWRLSFPQLLCFYFVLWWQGFGYHISNGNVTIYLQ